MDIRKHLLKKGVSLTPSQTQGLSLSEKPALLLAVPGSGKTTVLVARTAALLETGLPPDRMLNLTFSRNSAEDMRKRFELPVCAAPSLFYHSQLLPSAAAGFWKARGSLGSRHCRNRRASIHKLLDPPSPAPGHRFLSR